MGNCWTTNSIDIRNVFFCLFLSYFIFQVKYSGRNPENDRRAIVLTPVHMINARNEPMNDKQLEEVMHRATVVKPGIMPNARNECIDDKQLEEVIHYLQRVVWKQ